MKVQVVSDTIQKFNGVSYYLCGLYYQRKGRRLHREVWMHHNGDIPKGFHVHHLDGDRSHNDVENLTLLRGSDHLSGHMKQQNRREASARAIEIARVAACKWHGSEAGREFHSKHGKESWKKRAVQTYICTECGNEFQTKNVYAEGQNRFCSNNCRASHRRKSGVDNEQRVCPVCGKTYTVNRYSATKTCSRACSDKLRWGK